MEFTPTPAQTAPQESEELYIRLEQYDDIFSDFDIRPYAERALSVDFLSEIKRASQGKTGETVALMLYVPNAERSEGLETTIRTRLMAHFKRHYEILRKEKAGIMKTGWTMVALGVLSMIAATFVVHEDPSQSLLLSFLVVFLEPAAWFLLWEGMDQIIFHSKNINPELDFYKKMSASEGRIHFKSY